MSSFSLTSEYNTELGLDVGIRVMKKVVLKKRRSYQADKLRKLKNKKAAAVERLTLQSWRKVNIRRNNVVEPPREGLHQKLRMVP